MTRAVRTIFLLLLFTPALGAAVDFQAMIAKGTALHDQGRYEEAIAIYREVLRQDPENGVALYELDLSLLNSGAFEECVKVGESGLKLAPSFRPRFYLNEGNCLDRAGKAEEAVKVYSRGLAEFPADSPLAFNCAVTQFHLHRLKEARDLLKISLAGRPGHASSHLLLAQVYEAGGYRVPALLAALRFLSLEPASERSEVGARLAREALDRGVTRDPETKAVKVTIDTGAPKDEGDFSALAMQLAIVSGGRFAGDGAKRSEIEQLAGQVGALLSLLDRAPASARSLSFAEATYIPFLVSIRRANLAVPFAYLAFSSLGLPGTVEWTDHHPQEAKRLLEFLQKP